MFPGFKGGPGSTRWGTGGGSSGRGQNSSRNRNTNHKPAANNPGHEPVRYTNKPSATEPGKPEQVPMPKPQPVYTERPASRNPGKPRAGVSPADLGPIPKPTRNQKPRR